MLGTHYSGHVLAQLPRTQGLWLVLLLRSCACKCPEWDSLLETCSLERDLLSRNDPVRGSCLRAAISSATRRAAFNASSHYEIRPLSGLCCGSTSCSPTHIQHAHAHCTRTHAHTLTHAYTHTHSLTHSHKMNMHEDVHLVE